MGEEKKASSLRKRLDRAQKRHGRKPPTLPILVIAVVVVAAGGGLYLAFRAGPEPAPEGSTSRRSGQAPEGSTSRRSGQAPEGSTPRRSGQAPEGQAEAPVAEPAPAEIARSPAPGPAPPPAPPPVEPEPPKVRETHRSPYAQWENGVPTDPSFFPLAVWCQSPRNAGKYEKAGVNLYVALWKGPTEEQLEALAAAGMPVICHQNEVGLRSEHNSGIVGWMHGDEPDNAQSLEKYWKNDIARLKKEWPQLANTTIKWAVPAPPRRIQEGYAEKKAREPTRPILLNLGQGVAWDGWHGRGHRTNCPGDYLEYVKGADVVSFDIYPAVHRKPEIRGKLWYVAYGVMRLREWTNNEKIVWNCVEASNWVKGPDGQVAPSIVKTEAWMSIIHGSRGIIYFVHQFKPKFIEASVFADPRMAEGFAAINKRITSLAPAINSPTVKGGATVTSSVAASGELAKAGLEPIAIMVKQHDGATYLFSVRMEGSPARGTFRLKGLSGKAAAEVIGENRTIDVQDGAFADDFKGYEVHLYRIVPAGQLSRSSGDTASLMSQDGPLLFLG